MYRDDNDAIYNRLQDKDREAAELKAQNEAMRRQIDLQNAQRARDAMPVYYDVYRIDASALPEADRAALAYHRVTPFPVWAAGVLNVITFGLFSLIHFSMIHDRLPRGAANDPSAGKAIGFSFIPYYNLYWVFFNTLRLSDRIDLQYRIRGLPRRSPRGLLLACCIVGIIPYVNIFIGIPILWTIGVCLLQSAVNGVAELDPHQWQQPAHQGQSAHQAHQGQPRN